MTWSFLSFTFHCSHSIFYLYSYYILLHHYTLSCFWLKDHFFLHDFLSGSCWTCGEKDFGTCSFFSSCSCGFPFCSPVQTNAYSCHFLFPVCCVFLFLGKEPRIEQHSCILCLFSSSGSLMVYLKLGKIASFACF